MNERWQSLTSAFERLNPREQRLVAVFALLLVAAVARYGVYEPLVGGRERLAQANERLLAELGTLEDLSRRVRAEGKNQPAKPTTGESPDDFSLVAFLDKAAARAIDGEGVESMAPSRRELDGGLEETLVELRLSSVSLDEVVSLLRAIDRAAAPVYVKRLELRKRYDDTRAFDVLLVAGALARA